MLKNPFTLDGKLVLITGGGTGIGKAIAQGVVNAGGRVVINGRREEALADACKELGDQASYVVADITDLPGIPAHVKHIEDTIGPIYGLVNNAGIALPSHTLDVTDDDLLTVLTVHVRASFALIREIVPYMAQRKSGSIINICSLSAIFGVEGFTAYTAAKSALKGIVRPLAMEFAPLGVRINDIAPGWIETEMSRKAGNPVRRKCIEERNPLKRFGKPEEVAYGAVYLLSPAASYVNGAELVIDGGITNTGMYYMKERT